MTNGQPKTSGQPNRVSIEAAGEVAACDFLPLQQIDQPFGNPTGIIMLVKLNHAQILRVSANTPPGQITMPPDGRRARITLTVEWD